jgi:uncharacterized RDD family membrane protein YckC
VTTVSPDRPAQAAAPASPAPTQAGPPVEPAVRLAGRAVRFASLIYEAILLVPLLFLAGYLFLALTHEASAPLMRALFRLWLVCVLGAYFCYCWSRTGQTLAAKTWRLRVARPDGDPLSVARALARYVLALCGTILGGVGFWWAFLDRDGLFLHDRLAGTRVIRQPR